MDCLVATRSTLPQELTSSKLRDDLRFPNSGPSNFKMNDNDNEADENSDSDSIEDSTSKMILRNTQMSKNVKLPLDSVPSSVIPTDILAEIIEYNVKSAERERTFNGHNEPPLSSMINKNPYSHVKHNLNHTNNGNDDEQSSCSSSSVSESESEDKSEDKNGKKEDEKCEVQTQDTSSKIKIGEQKQHQISDATSNFDSSDEENSDDYETIDEFPASSSIISVSDTESISDSDHSKVTNSCKKVFPPSPSPIQFQQESKRNNQDEMCKKSSTIHLSDPDPDSDPELKKKRKREKKERRKDKDSKIRTTEIAPHFKEKRSIPSVSSNTNTNKSSNNTIKSFLYKNPLLKKKERGRPVKFHLLSSLNFDTRLIKGHSDLDLNRRGQEKDAKNPFNSSRTSGTGIGIKKDVNSNILDTYLYAAVPESSTLKEACTKMYKEDPITGQIVQIKRVKQDNQSDVLSSLHLNEKRHRERIEFIRRVNSRNLWGIGPRLRSGATLVSECVIEDVEIIPINESNKNNDNNNKEDVDTYDDDHDSIMELATKTKTMVDASVQFPPIWSWTKNNNKYKDKNSNLNASKSTNTNNIFNSNVNKNKNDKEEVDATCEEYDGVFIEDLVNLCPQSKSESKSNSTTNTLQNFNINYNNYHNNIINNNNNGDGDNFTSFLFSSDQIRTNPFLLPSSSSTSSLLPGWKPGFSGIVPPVYERPGTVTAAISNDMGKNKTNRRLVAISGSQIVSSNPESGSCECFLEPLIYPVEDKNNDDNIIKSSKSKNENKKEQDPSESCTNNNNNTNNDKVPKNCLQQELKDENNNYHTFNLIAVGSSDSKNNNGHKNTNINVNTNSIKESMSSTTSSTTTFSNHPRNFRNSQNLKGTSPASSHNTDTDADEESSNLKNGSSSKLQNYFNDSVVKITSAEELAQHLRQFSLKISQSKLGSRSKSNQENEKIGESAFLTAALENKSGKDTQFNPVEKKSKSKGKAYKWSSSLSSSNSYSDDSTVKQKNAPDFPSRTAVPNSVPAQIPLELKAGLSMQRLLKLNPVQRLKYMRDSYKQNFWPSSTAQRPTSPAPSNLSPSSRPKSRSNSRPYSPTEQQEQEQKQQDVEYNYPTDSSFKPTTLTQQKYKNSYDNNNDNNNVESYTVRSLANWITPHNSTKNWKGTGLMTTNALMDFTEAAITSRQ